jgi:hypothetical protein
MDAPAVSWARPDPISSGKGKNSMLYKQVRSNDHGNHTNLQVKIGMEKGKPVFQHFGKKVTDRIHIENGSVFSVEEKPIIGADNGEYYKIIRSGFDQYELPSDWPTDAYLKGLDLTEPDYPENL